MVEVGSGATNIILAVTWGLQPLSHNKPKGFFFFLSRFPTNPWDSPPNLETAGLVPAEVLQGRLQLSCPLRLKSTWAASEGTFGPPRYDWVDVGLGEQTFSNFMAVKWIWISTTKPQ